MGMIIPDTLEQRLRTDSLSGDESKSFTIYEVNFLCAEIDALRELNRQLAENIRKERRES